MQEIKLYALPTMYYPNEKLIQKKFNAEKRIRRKAKKESNRVKLKQCKKSPIVNENRYHKNMFR